MKYLEENIKAVDVKLSDEEVKEIRAEIEKVGGGKGSRYPEAALKDLLADSPELEK